MTWEEVMSSPEKKKWKQASDKEIHELVDKRNTWTIVPISEAKGHKILPTTWVFRLKRFPDGTPKKMKARLVVRGDLQEGISDVYAPVVEFFSVRFFLAYSRYMNWITCAIDLLMHSVKLIFLN